MRMADYLDSYDESYFHEKLETILGEESLKNSPVEGTPHAFLLGGQSGAGKTTLQDVLPEKTGLRYSVINGDTYRKGHPHFAQLDAKYGKDAVSHTAAWAGAMTEAFIDRLSELRYNLIVEGTLRTSEVPLKTATLLRSRGYEVSLALMAVKPEISLLSCQIRYEMMRLAGTTPRATDPAYHDKIVHDIVDNLALLEQSELFAGVYLYDRAGRCLFPTGNPGKKASETLRGVLFGDWTEEERLHEEHLQGLLNDLRKR